jgi:hypothetical protein
MELHSLQQAPWMPLPLCTYKSGPELVVVQFVASTASICQLLCIKALLATVLFERWRKQALRVLSFRINIRMM